MKADIAIDSISLTNLVHYCILYMNLALIEAFVVIIPSLILGTHFSQSGKCFMGLVLAVFICRWVF